MREIRYIVGIRACLAVFCLFFAAGCVLPPGQPETGYGSGQGYICGAVSPDKAIVFGNDPDGTKAWVFFPELLKNGNSAPVVVYLHGYSATNPIIYQGHIDHLVKQGVIVIYPQFSLTGVTGALTDLDQNMMLERAIVIVQNAFSIPVIAEHAEMENITLVSHSLGGMLSLCWEAGDGVQVKNMVLLHPNISNDAIPDFVENYFDIITLDYETLALSTTCPVIIIGGADDTIAMPEHVQAAYDSLINAPSRVYYEVQTDDYGFPSLSSDHIGPLQFGITAGDDGKLGFVSENAIDYRVYYAAVDAAIDDQTHIAFDMGEWKDGTLVVPVVLVEED